MKRIKFVLNVVQKFYRKQTIFLDMYQVLELENYGKKLLPL